MFYVSSVDDSRNIDESQSIDKDESNFVKVSLKPTFVEFVRKQLTLYKNEKKNKKIKSVRFSILMMRIFTHLVLIYLVTAEEHWFAFDQHQYLGFYTPLFTLQTDKRNLTFTLLTYDRSINVDITSLYPNGTRKDYEQPIKLNAERADLLYNALNHLMFIAVKQQNKIEVYANCKLIDSYLLYSSSSVDDKSSEKEENSYVVDKLQENIKHFHSSTNDQYHHTLFENYGCKQSSLAALDSGPSIVIGRPLIRKMQQIIEKVQQRKLRSRFEFEYKTKGIKISKNTKL